MAEIQTFRAETMQEALSMVRRQLGPDAFILHTRQVPRRSLLPWQKEKFDTEILAVKDEPSETPVAQAAVSGHAPAARPASHPQTSESPRPRTTLSPAPAPLRPHFSAPPASDTPRADISSAHRSRFSTTPLQPTSETSSPAAPTHEPSHEPPKGFVPSRFDSLPPSGRSERILSKTPELNKPTSTRTQPPQQRSSAVETVTESPRNKPSLKISEVDSTQVGSTSEDQAISLVLGQKLDLLQKMLEKLSHQMEAGNTSTLPNEFTTLHQQLVETEVDESLVRELMVCLQQSCSVVERTDPQLVQETLEKIIESQVHCRGPIRVYPGHQKIVALVGPTGVGKTTTLAKLAANFRLRDRIKMGLITVDTYRIAAVEQLRTYAEIIDLPMKVVTNAEEMKQAVQELAGLDLILIDTAGRSPQDDLRIQELRTFLSEIVIDEIHLVLSATTGSRNLKKIVEKFDPIQPSAVILTKLDEASGQGALVNIPGRLGLPLSYLTIGQNVPRDIEPACSRRAARLVLGQEQIETQHSPSPDSPSFPPPVPDSIIS